MKIYFDDVRFIPDDTWEEVRYPIDLYSILLNNPQHITEISLDHDIECYVWAWAWCEEYTWYDVLKTILLIYERAELPLPKITFHTANPVWREKMEQLLASFINKHGKRNNDN